MNDEVPHWLEQIQHGNSAAAHQIWMAYFERLVGAARQQLMGSNRAVSDEEDVAVSVFESFFRAAEKGRFPDLSGEDDLWRLLLRMAARKVVDKRRRDGRQKRSADGPIISISPTDDESERAMIDVIGDEPTPEMVAMMTESCEQLLGHLSDENLREIAIAKMEGFSNRELSERFACSERTIERRLRLIREKCEQELMHEEDDE